MRVMVIGAGPAGAKVLRQLRKNPKLTVVTVDPRERPYAVEQGIIDAVDVREPVTPLNLEHVVTLVEPDLVLLTRSADDLELGSAPGMDLLSGSLRDELSAISSVPMITVARS